MTEKIYEVVTQAFVPEHRVTLVKASSIQEVVNYITDEFHNLDIEDFDILSIKEKASIH